MCGIAGIIGPHDTSVITAMTDALHHRGPDDQGYHSAGELSISSRRLSIIGIDNGAQPIYNEQGDICVVANCEIYNYRELRDELRGMGHVFRTNSDAEVIVHLYEEYGDQCVHRLQGMFAFAIADGNRLLLARDRFGIKPLYYAGLTSPDIFIFGSELKSLLQCTQLVPEIDMPALLDTVVFGHSTGATSVLRGVFSLPAGNLLTATKREAGFSVSVSSYYQLPEISDDAVPFHDAAKQLMALLHETVRSHLMAETEVGITLSGGLDSVILAMIMRDLRDGPIQAFTIGDRPDHPDVVQARRVATQLGLIHHVSILSFQDFIATIPRYITAAEQPAGLGGVALNFLCRRIGADLKVCLNGEGADEVFGGYGEYVDRRFRGTRMTDKATKLKEQGLSLSSRGGEVLEALSADQPFPQYLKKLFVENMREQLTRDHLELLDAGSMAASLEMRVPYLDHHVVEFAFRQPMEYRVDYQLGIGKRLLKQAALTTYGDNDVMVGSVLRRKIGAPTSVLGHRERFARLCDQVLPEDYLIKDRYGFCFDQKSDLLIFNLFAKIFTIHRGIIPDGFTMLDFIAEQARKPILSIAG